MLKSSTTKDLESSRLSSYLVSTMLKNYATWENIFT